VNMDRGKQLRYEAWLVELEKASEATGISRDQIIQLLTGNWNDHVKPLLGWMEAQEFIQAESK